MSIFHTRQATAADLNAIHEWQRKECILGRKNSYLDILPHLLGGKLDKHRRIFAGLEDNGVSGFAMLEFKTIALFEGSDRIAKLLVEGLVRHALDQDWRELKIGGKFPGMKSFWIKQGFEISENADAAILYGRLPLLRKPSMPAEGKKVAVAVRYFEDGYQVNPKLQTEYVGEGVMNDLQEVFLPFEAICPYVTSRCFVEVEVAGETIFNKSVISPEFQYLGAKDVGEGGTRLIDKIDLFTWKQLNFKGVPVWS